MYSFQKLLKPTFKPKSSRFVEKPRKISKGFWISIIVGACFFKF